MQDARIRWALAAVGLLIFGGSGLTLYATHRASPAPVVITQPPAAPAAPITDNLRTAGVVPPPAHKAAPTIYVHVAGAVKRPSLYCLAPGSRVMQAVKAAGGPAPKADLDAINLAEKVRDGEKVYVPVRQSQAAMLAPPGNTLGHASVIPTDDSVTADTPPTETASAPKAAKSASAKRGGGDKADKITSPTQGQVNLNTATADQLQRLPGIGPAMAARILSYRTQAHGFQKADELMEVGGIGPKKFAKIAPLVKLH